MTDIAGSVAFITGGQRGLGKAFAEELLARGAAKVYVTARSPIESTDARLIPVALDVTDETAVARVAAEASDVTIVINNAGVGGAGALLTSSLEQVRDVFETNVFGALTVAKAFAPVLAANGGGALVDIHSALSWVGGAGAYGASKAAIWSLTNSLRKELSSQRTSVVGVHLGYADTDMTRNVTAPKIPAADVATAVVDGIAAGAAEVLVDDTSRWAKSILSGPVEALVV
jgi:NAD(P)-dependent dehydrogenase (short-subunit alcohol dehydrogenase family)